MDRQTLRKSGLAGSLLALLLALPAISAAQVPVDDAGQDIAVATSEEIPLLSAAELAELVGPIALYPDDLLAIVLPATTYPLQLVQAQRFLDNLKNDASLKPDEDWDESVVALLNYPEVIELLTDELDQTWRLGEAVVAQQADVVAAVESFRDRAYAAGNLQSDARQTVTQNDGVIEIQPVAEDVIYVPYYEPERVVVYQSRPAYYYYPRPYPVYYYPYPYGYTFSSGFFWGVTTAFTVGWYTDSLYVYHHSYYGHPYYGHHYYHNHWYRHADVHVHNNYYYGGHSGHHGNYWYPHSSSTVSHHDQRVTRSRQYPGTATRSSAYQPTASGQSTSRQSVERRTEGSRSDIRFRERDAIRTTQARPTQSQALSTARTSNKAITSTSDIRFRERPAESRATQRQANDSRPVATSQRQAQLHPTQPSRSSYRATDSGKSLGPGYQAANSSQVSRPDPQRSYSGQSSRPSPERSYSGQSSRPSPERSYSSQSSSRQSSYSGQPQRSASSGSGFVGKAASAARGKADSGTRNRH